MMMELLPWSAHFLELRHRTIKLVFLYILFFVACYCYKDNIYRFLLNPLLKINAMDNRKIIYTGLTEAFFSYLKLTCFCSFILTIPFIAWHVYAFISKGLYKYEKLVVASLLIFSPILFLLGSGFVYYFLMPKAWMFFLSFEDHNVTIPLQLEARISEYLSLIIQLVIAFGIAFQAPIILIILNLLKIITAQSLINKRRIAIVINFILGGILTPPDVLSQFALAIPLILLYEISIIICKIIDNRITNARHQVD